MPDFVLPFLFPSTLSATLTSTLTTPGLCMAVLDADMLFRQGPRVELQAMGFLMDAEVHVVTYGQNFGVFPVQRDTILQFSHPGMGWRKVTSPKVDITLLLRKDPFLDITIAAKEINGSGAVENITVYVIVPEVRRTAGTRVR